MEADLGFDLMTRGLAAAPILIMTSIGLAAAVWLGARSRTAGILLTLGLVGITLAKVAWIVIAAVIGQGAAGWPAERAQQLWLGASTAIGLIEWLSLLACIGAAVAGRRVAGA